MDTLKIWEYFEKYGFFSTMRHKFKIREERYKADNDDLSSIGIDVLIDHLFSEVDEFKEAINKLSNEDNIQEECADIANICGLIYSKIEYNKREDNYKCHT